MDSHILHINAHLKYVEYVLSIFDAGDENLTLKEIRQRFLSTFKTRHHLLNQYFGVYRLVPLLLIREEIKGRTRENNSDEEKIMIIRHAVAHNKFGITEEGYVFECDRGRIALSYEEFVGFVYRIENNFYMSQRP